MVHGVMALLFVLLGYLVRFRQWAWLISGYNTSSRESRDQYDREALTRGVGNTMFVLAALMVVSALGQWLRVPFLTRVGWGGFVLAILVFLVYANTGNRYKKHS